MTKRIRKKLQTSNKKIISCKRNTSYSFVFENRKLSFIIVENIQHRHCYYFEPSVGQNEVTTDVLKDALKSLLQSDTDSFDVVCVCFNTLNNGEKYYKIAIEVFKEYWNELYNTIIAEDVFKRQCSFETIDKKYDYFKVD